MSASVTSTALEAPPPLNKSIYLAIHRTVINYSDFSLSRCLSLSRARSLSLSLSLSLSISLFSSRQVRSVCWPIYCFAPTFTLSRSHWIGAARYVLPNSSCPKSSFTTITYCCWNHQCTRHMFDGRAEHDLKRRAKLKEVGSPFVGPRVCVRVRACVRACVCARACSARLCCWIIPETLRRLSCVSLNGDWCV